MREPAAHASGVARRWVETDVAETERTVGVGRHVAVAREAGRGDWTRGARVVELVERADDRGIDV